MTLFVEPPHIQKLYRIETRLKGKSAQQKYQVRQAESLPLLNQYKAWLDKSVLHVPPKTALGKALGYSAMPQVVPMPVQYSIASSKQRRLMD